MSLEILSKIEGVERRSDLGVTYIVSHLRGQSIIDDDAVETLFSYLRSVLNHYGSTNGNHRDDLLILKGKWPFSSYFLDSCVDLKSHCEYNTASFGTIGGSFSLMYLSGQKRYVSTNSLLLSITLPELLRDFNSTIISRTLGFIPEINDPQTTPIRDILKNYASDKVLDFKLINMLNTDRIYRAYLETNFVKISKLAGRDLRMDKVMDINSNYPYYKLQDSPALEKNIEDSIKEINSLMDQEYLRQRISENNYSNNSVSIFSSRNEFAMTIDEEGHVDKITMG